jgi:hypothetical protein
MFLDGLLEFGRVDEVCRAEFPGPFFLIIVGIDSNDLLCTVCDAALEDAEPNAPGTKDCTSGAFLDLGGSGCGTVTSRNTTA